jgi:excisionase family DNA binding protein
MTQGDRLLTIEQVAERLAVARRTVFRLIERGELRVVRIGRATRIAESDLSEYIERLRNEADR